MPLSFHEYTPDDFEACCAVFLSNTPRFFARAELEEYRQFLQTEAPGNYWCLKDDNGAAVACGGIWRPSPAEGRLCFGMVPADNHKKHLGSLLLTWRLLKLMEEPALKTIRLDTTQHNPGFFSRFGFETVTNLENHYAPGLHRHDMALAVTPGRREAIRQAYESLYDALLRRERAA